MLIIWDNSIINTANLATISVDDQKLTYDIAGGNQIVQTCDPAPAARKVFNQIVDALIVGERILDLRRTEND